MTGAKFFTPRQADRTLPLVKRIVEDILETGQLIRERSMVVGASAAAGAPPEADPEIVRSIEHLEKLISEIEELGCSYRDWNFTVGLVDFPAIIDGEEVCLCWRSDEAGLGYYHTADAGFAGRKPIPPEYLDS